MEKKCHLWNVLWNLCVIWLPTAAQMLEYSTAATLWLTNGLKMEKKRQEVVFACRLPSPAPVCQEIRWRCKGLKIWRSDMPLMARLGRSHWSLLPNLFYGLVSLHHSGLTLAILRSLFSKVSVETLRCI